MTSLVRPNESTVILEPPQPFCRPQEKLRLLVSGIPFLGLVFRFQFIICFKGCRVFITIEYWKSSSHKEDMGSRIQGSTWSQVFIHFWSSRHKAVAGWPSWCHSFKTPFHEPFLDTLTDFTPTRTSRPRRRLTAWLHRQLCQSYPQDDLLDEVGSFEQLFDGQIRF